MDNNLKNKIEKLKDIRKDKGIFNKCQSFRK